MSSTRIGRDAEELVAKTLENDGHKIIALNWRRRSCEVDIITTKNQAAYLVEVKYRSSEFSGSGLEYITPAKLKQMRYAAELWIMEADWSGDVLLLAASVDSTGKIEIVECD